MSEPKKEEKIFERVEEEDYRGLMSLLVVGGYVGALLIFAWKGDMEGLKTVGSILGPFVGTIAGWYFREKVGR